MVAGCQARGLDATAGRYLAGHLRQTGSLTDVAEKSYRYPFHKDGNTAAGRRLGEYSYKIHVPFLLILTRCLFPDQIEEERKAMEAEAQANKEVLQPGMYVMFFVAWARKETFGGLACASFAKSNTSIS
jgi:hypothetical protein